MSGDTSGARSLKTAAMVLRALRLLGDHPEGLSPAEIGTRLGKSSATARYMVNTLCEAGFAYRDDETGRCRLPTAPPWGTWAPTEVAEPVDLAPGDPAPGAVMSEAVTELYRRTRQRTYLVRRTGTLVASVCDVRGHQGLARLPGLDAHVQPERAHALAFTKVLLAASPTYRESLAGEDLVALTPATVTCPVRLATELDEVASRGWAVDDEEYARGFSTVAAPITAPSGTSTVALGLACSARRFAAHAEELIAAVVAVADGARREWAGQLGEESVEEDDPAPADGSRALVRGRRAAPERAGTPRRPGRISARRR